MIAAGLNKSAVGLPDVTVIMSAEQGWDGVQELIHSLTEGLIIRSIIVQSGGSLCWFNRRGM